MRPASSAPRSSSDCCARCPTASSCSSCGPAAAGAGDRVAREVLRNDAFDRLRRELGGSSLRRDGRAPRHRHRRRRRRSTASASTTTAARCSRRATSSSTRRRRSGSTRRSTPRSRSTCSARCASRRCSTSSASTPHLVAVSTCYVAGSRRGAAPEELVDESPFFVDVDWRHEVDAARRARLDAETASRTPEKLAEFRKAARHELGAAGTPLLAEKTESLRAKWVDDRMVAVGRARAGSLGFPDAYAFTKAIGERALAESRGNVPVSIVRPSIIESAIAEPIPGWIRGFRMAEPVILSYATRSAEAFPGVPEGIVDVIPVDHVVAAICAVAARGPAERPSKPDVVQVASGSVNPLRYGELVDLVREWFTEHPLYDDRGQAIAVSEWAFPGRGRVQTTTDPGQARPRARREDRRLLPCAARRPRSAPRSKRSASSSTARSATSSSTAPTPSAKRSTASIDCSALWESLDDDDRRDFAFDPRAIDWDHYVQDVHLPTVVHQARAKTTPGAKAGPTRVGAPARAGAGPRAPPRGVRPREHAHRIQRRGVLLVARDAPVELATTAPASSRKHAARSAHAARARPPRPQRLPALLLPSLRGRADRPDRRRRGRDVQRPHPHQVVPGGDPARARAPRARPPHRAHHRRARLRRQAARAAVRPHHRGRTWAPPTARRATTAASPRAAHRRDPRPGADRLRRRSTASRCASRSPTPTRRPICPMLEAVGFPVAVNPETRLATIARKRGWLIEDFRKSGRRQAVADRTDARPATLAGCCDALNARATGAPMKALVFERKLAKFAAAAVAGRFVAGRGAKYGPLTLKDVDAPDAARTGLGARSAAPRRHLRQRPRHHRRPLVAVLRADRVVPVHARPRGRRRPRRRHSRACSSRCCTARRAASSPPCDSCAAGRINHCERIAFGHLEPGLQSGFCETPAAAGRWRWPRTRPAARCPRRPHRRAGGDDRARGVRGARGARAVHRRHRPVVVVGSGALGLLTLAALRHPSATCAPSSPRPSTPSSAAGPRARRGPRRRASRARAGGAQRDRVADDRRSRSPAAPTVVDCVGSEASLAESLEVVAPGGTVLVVGMPGHTHLDLTPLWHRESRSAAATPTPATTSTTALALVQHGRPRSSASVPPIPSTATPRRSTTPPTPARAARCASRSTSATRSNARTTDGKASTHRGRASCSTSTATPADLFHHGEGFRLERLPAGRTRVVYPADPLPGLADPDGAIRNALLHPIDCDPLPALSAPGHEAHHRVRRHLVAAAADAQARRSSAHHRSRARHGRRGRRRRRAHHRRARAASAHDRSRAASRSRRSRLRRVRTTRPALQPRRRGPRRHGDARRRPTTAKKCR